MKSFFRYLSLFVFFLMLSSTMAYSQFSITKVQDQNTNTAQDGFYYALPQTVLKVDLLIEKITTQKGPLSEFTQEYLGTSDYIKSNSVSYRLINVMVEPLAEADPEQIYYVQFPAARPKDAKPMGFSLTPMGTLAAFNAESNENVISEETDIQQTIIVSDDEDGFNYFADYNRTKKIDTIIRKITIDTVTIDRFLFKTSWVDKSQKEKANEAAMQIAKIRESRFNLITGYQEVNYGESMRYMDQQLNILEKRYLELFLGKETKTIETQTVYFIPSKEINSKTLYRGSDGSTIDIKATASGSTAKLAETPLAKQDNIYYRIPEFALVEITQNGNTHYRKKIAVSQFGIIAAAPLNKTRLQFDPLTGSLVRIIRE
jgi:hypothetical protein